MEDPKPQEPKPQEPKPQEPKPQEPSAKEIALEQTVNELKEQVNSLTKSNKDLQVSLEKMALQVGTKSPTDEDLFKEFSKYERR